MTPPSTIEEWKALPELKIPEIKSPHEQGLIIQVLKVGVLTAPLAKCREAGLTGVSELRGLPPPALVALPTVTVEADAGPKLYRLPHSLGDWAYMNVAFAMQGHKLFPEKVEFNLLHGRYTADIL